MSKVIIALPTSIEFVSIFEETLAGGFSSVNTRLAFDTQILYQIWLIVKMKITFSKKITITKFVTN